MEQIQEDHKRYTPEEYFALLEQSEEKLEYHDGEVFMMVGGTASHNAISVNVARRILEGTDNKDCTGYSSDMASTSLAISVISSQTCQWCVGLYNLRKAEKTVLKSNTFGGSVIALQRGIRSRVEIIILLTLQQPLDQITH